MFKSNARAYLRSWVCLYTLAYHDEAKITSVQSFIVQAPEVTLYREFIYQRKKVIQRTVIRWNGVAPTNDGWTWVLSHLSHSSHPFNFFFLKNMSHFITHQGALFVSILSPFIPDTVNILPNLTRCCRKFGKIYQINFLKPTVYIMNSLNFTWYGKSFTEIYRMGQKVWSSLPMVE